MVGKSELLTSTRLLVLADFQDMSFLECMEISLGRFFRRIPTRYLHIMGKIQLELYISVSPRAAGIHTPFQKVS